MPNHVHWLFTPKEYVSVDDATGSALIQIMHSLKSYTANEANKILNRKGPFGAENITIIEFGVRNNLEGFWLISWKIP